MPMTFHTYRTIKRTLAQTLHARPGSHLEQHVNTLAMLICGIVGAQHVQFALIADHAPFRGAKNESLITRFRRWVKHKDITPDAVWLPFARAVLAALALAPLTLVLDGTTAGRGCMVLMASVVYHRRAIPLLWRVVKGKKGHLPQDEHCALITRLQTIIPATAEVVVLGDGEFDGTQLQAALRTAGWDYVCRTGVNITIYAHDRVFPVGDLPLKRGEAVALENVQMTAERYGPVLLLGIWETNQDTPIYLITSLSDARAAADWYRLRFRIEIVFTQMTKGGGFPSWAGGQDIADLDLAVGDDDAIDQEFDQLSALGKIQVFQGRLKALAEGSDSFRQFGHIDLALRLGVQLAQLLRGSRKINHPIGVSWLQV
jgi:hypothetical protein